jgi:hypothetical protein
MFTSNVTNTVTLPDPTFLEPCKCNKAITHRHPRYFLLQLPSVAMMALCRNVATDNTILCELYVDTFSDVSDDGETEIFDSNSDTPSMSFRKQSQPCPLVFTSDGAKLTKGPAMNLSAEPQV